MIRKQLEKKPPFVSGKWARNLSLAGWIRDALRKDENGPTALLFSHRAKLIVVRLVGLPAGYYFNSLLPQLGLGALAVDRGCHGFGNVVARFRLPVAVFSNRVSL